MMIFLLQNLRYTHAHLAHLDGRFSLSPRGRPMLFIICNFCSFGGNKLIFCVSEDNVCIFMYGKYYYCV